MKLDWKAYAIISAVVVFSVMAFFLTKVLVFLLITLFTVGVAVLVGFIQPLKYVGIELITFSTLLVGVVFGPVIGAVYGISMLMTHLILGRYYIGNFLIWLIPEYALIGIVAGNLQTGIVGMSGVVIVAVMNLLNLVLTGLMEHDRLGKYFPYFVGNIIMNSVLILSFFDDLVALIG